MFVFGDQPATLDDTKMDLALDEACGPALNRGEGA
jgi:hypothetical protein